MRAHHGRPVRSPGTRYRGPVASQDQYDALWAEGRARMVLGDLRPDRTPTDGDPRWGLSLVLLPAEETARRLAGVTSELDAAYRGGHHLYGVADLHMTITSLEPYRDRIAPETVQHYVDAIDRSRDLLDVRCRLLGLGGSAAGVFVQGFDDDSLLPIRVRMRQAAADLHGGTAPPMAFVRDTAHISLSVHRQAGPENAAVAVVERSRRRDFGDLQGSRVALVRYRPRVGSMGVEMLHTVG